MIPEKDCSIHRAAVLQVWPMEMSDLRPTQDLPSGDLHFNKVPRGFVHTLKFEKHR